MAAEIPQWRNVDQRVFESEIAVARKPAVLKGLVADWPLVRKGMESAAAAVADPGPLFLQREHDR